MKYCDWDSAGRSCGIGNATWTVGVVNSSFEEQILARIGLLKDEHDCTVESTCWGLRCRGNFKSNCNFLDGFVLNEAIRSLVLPVVLGPGGAVWKDE